MKKARAVVVSIWVSALLALSPSPAPAWFADAHLYSNLQWSPDGTKIFYEDRFIGPIESAGECEYYLPMAMPEIRCVDVATGEVAGVVPGAIYINPAATRVPIKIEKLYGFELCSAEAGLSPEAYSVAAIERARDALYISEDFTRFIFETVYSYEHDGHDAVWEDARTGSREFLVEGAEHGTVYLKKSHSLVYTLEEGEKGSASSFPGMYLLDLSTGLKRRLGSFYLMGVTADESRATVSRSSERLRMYNDDRLVMSISLAADEPEPKKLVEGQVRIYGLSRRGTKLLYEEEGSLRVVDSTTAESVDLAKDAYAWTWSPDDRYLVFQLYAGMPPGRGIFVFDGDARKLVGSFESPHVHFFSWSPSAKYVAFKKYEPAENLRLIDVEGLEEWSVQEGEAAFFCWVGGSRFLYSSGGKLYVYDCEKKEGRVVYAWFSEGDCEVLTWINDSQLIFVRETKAFLEYGNLHLLDVRTGAHRVLAPANGCDFSFAEDGNLVFRARDMPRGYPEYWELDFATGYVAPYQGAVEDVARGSSARGDVVVPSPDGGRVAVLEGGKLTLRDADGSNAATLMEKGKGVNVGKLAKAEPKNAVWSPAGDKVAWLRVGFVHDENPFTDIWVASRDGGDVRVLLEADTNFNYTIYGKR